MTTTGPLTDLRGLSDAALIACHEAVYRDERRLAASCDRRPDALKALALTAARQMLAVIRDQAPEHLRDLWGLRP